MIDESTFLSNLQAQAKRQAVLHQKRILPRRVDWLSSLIGTYPWQMLLLTSLITATILKFWR